MHASQPSPRPEFIFPSLALTFSLACFASFHNAALAQHSAPPPAQQTHTLHLRFSGEQPRPLAMVSGDFDEDGVADLVIGYATEDGGSIELIRGNPEAITPRTHADWLAAGRHEYIDSFLQSSKPMALKSEPSLMATADVNGDGHLDLVYAAKDSDKLNLMLGTGKGTFLAKTNSIALPGTITALSSYRPGAPLLGDAVTVGWDSGHGYGISIVSYGGGGWSIKATYKLPGMPTQFTVAQLDSDFIPDTAIVAGGKLLVLHGLNAIEGKGHLESLDFSGVERVAAGNFLFDRHGLPQLSVLTTGGEVLFLAHRGFDPQPYTPAEIAQARRNAMRHNKHALTLAQQAGDNGSAPWVEVERHSGPELGSIDSGSSFLLRSRMSGSGGDDLVVLNPSQQQRVTISHSVLPARTLASALDQAAAYPYTPSRVRMASLASGGVVSALPMRVSADGRQGLVVLRQNDPSPEITVPAAGNTFYVNTTADNTGTTVDSPDGTRCSQGSGEPCTLRDAITFVNSDESDNVGAGKSDTVMVPAGTYTLTFQANTLDANGNYVTHLELYGPVTIVGNGAIINGNNNDTVFTINPGIYGTYNTGGNSYVFDATLENLTLENGKNNNNPNNSGTGLSNDVGGGINWDAFGTGNLSLSSVTVENNSILWGAGGGIWAYNSASAGDGTLTVTNSTIENNSTSEQGGGVYIAYAPSGLTMSNSTVSNNKASISVNTEDTGGGDGTDDGGGIFLNSRPGGSGIPAASLSSLTISSNTADGDGGGINAGMGATITTSVISDNSSTYATSAGETGNPDAFNGGGFWSEILSPETAPTITSTNFLGNSAYSAGGAIAVGSATTAEGNILQFSLNRIYGNTSTNGASGLALGQANGTGGVGEADAPNNWWGCNAGPTTSADGCDQAAKYPTGTSSGTLTVSPWAEFLFSAATSTTITLGGDIDLSLTLDTNSSDGTITGAFPAVSSDSYTYSFNVTGVTADSIPNGTFSTGGTGSATLTPTGTGTGTISAKFDGQTDSFNFTVDTISTSVVLEASPSATYNYGVPSSFTAELLPTDAAGISAGDFSVTVDGASSIGAASFGATLETGTTYLLTGPFNLISPGNHTLKVSFSGTSDYATSNTSITITVAKGAASVAGVVSPATPIQFQGGTVTVTVTPTGTGATPTGTVAYAFDGGTPGAVSLSSGSATISIPTIIATGSHSLSLTYSGDTNYSSAVDTVTFTVENRSETFFASLTATSATIDVFGFGFTAPSGQLSFTDVTTSSPVAAPVTLNTSTATTALTPQTTTSTGTNTLPVWTTLGDLNGDGIPDLITSLFETDSVSVQLGNGDGTFQAASTILIATGFGPAEAHLASLRGNGTLDIIVGSFKTNQIAVLLGNDDGTFQPPAFYTVGSATNTPTSLTTGDFNDDGNLDVAVANTGDNTVSILLGNASGALTVSGEPINVGRDPEAIRAGDFNGDGYSDLAVANYQDGTVTSLLNNENGTFTASTISVGSGAGSGPQALAITGSGSSLLLAVANYKDNTVSVMQSNGSGAFGAQTIVSVGKGPDDVNFADFNGDGIEDLVVSNYTDGAVDLLLGSGGGAYTLSRPFPVGNNPYSAAVADIDQDGTPDVVVSNCFSNNTGVLLDGTEIAVSYSGLSLAAGNTLQAAYTPDGASKYGSSTSANTTAP
jgi:trimeric autotransporter adhesin